MDYHKSSSFNRPRVGSVYFVMEEIKEEVPEVTTAPSTASRRKVASPLSLVAIQFALLLWKNVLLQVRRPLGTFFEIITPLSTVSVLLILRFTVFSTSDNCFVTYNSDPLVIPTIQSYTVYYAPNTTEVNELVSNYVAPLLVASGGSMEGVATVDDIQTAAQESNITRTRGCFLGGAGVYFESITGDDIKFSIRLRYETIGVYWLLDHVAAPLELAGPRHVPYPYLDEGFMHLQRIVSEGIIHYKTGQAVAVNVESRQIPSPVYARDFFVFSLDLLLPLLISISFVYSVGVFVKELVLEKESRAREMMKIMGLSNWILTVTWFIKEFVFLIFTIIIFSIMLKYGQILPKTNLLLLILFFVLFITSTIAFCFLLSSLFSSATLGLLAGILTWSTLSIIHFFINQSYDTIPFVVKFFLSLFSSNLCTGFGIQVLARLERTGLGLNYDTFFSAVSFTDTYFSMGWTFLILFLNTIIYMILFWYIDAVFPGRYGIAKPPYFFLLPSYWIGKRYNKKSSKAGVEEIPLEPVVDNEDRNQEPEPVGLSVGISINKLEKIFNPKSKDSKVTAVSNMSLKMFEGQITALLGHNGAGKTTTINMLAGFFPPTSGTAYINGLSVVNDIDQIRNNLGLCPQHNVLFDRLTVREHLRFFIKLKGIIGDTTEEIDDMLDDLELFDKSDVQSQNLSGGMKRKLSVAISLIGGSKFVILDEPSSGMDPYARHITWELLIKHKKGRTILLTTQFMDEADILGDRIAIMKSGRVKTSGSSLFLKKRYGCGYHLTIEKTSLETDSDDVIELVQDKVRGSKFLYDIGAEIVMLLPDQESHRFANLMDKMEKNMASLGISSFGVSVTTMEEVFIQVGKDEDEILEKKIERKRSEYFNKKQLSLLAESLEDPQAPNNNSTIKRDNEGFNTGLALIWQQFYAMIVKHLYYFTRFWMGLILSIVLPILFVLLSLLIIKFDDTETTTVRNLSLVLPDLAEESSNITFFWAKFGSNFPIYFGADNASLIQATDFFDFTSDIESIRSSVTNITRVDECCNYNYQILDKYCASRTADELSVCDNSNFGYSLCMNCLSCCEAKSHKIPTCSDPSAESSYPNDEIFCPAPPVLSITDRASATSPVGHLDDINTYVAEKLLQYIDEVNIGIFESLFQGGFVLHNTPVSGYATCGCENTAETCTYLTPALTSSLASIPTSPTFTSIDSFVSTFCSAINETDPNCHLLTSPSSWNQDYSGTLAACVDQSACDLSQYQCQCASESQCLFGRTSPVVSSVPTATIWYNHKAYHTAPVVLNSFYNLYLKSFNSSLSLTVTNYPFHSSIGAELGSLTRVTYQTHSITIAVTISLGFSFLYASITILLTKEREEKSKHLQFVGGVHSRSYWIAAYVKDSLVNLFVLAVTMILFGSIQASGFTGRNLGAVFLLFFFCMISCHSIAYICTFVFSNSLVGFTILFILFAFPAVMLNAVIYILVLAGQTDVNITDTLHYLFMFHPVYGLASGLSAMYNNEANVAACTQSEEASQICDAIGARVAYDIFQLALPGIGHLLIVLVVEAVVFTALVFGIEKNFFIQEIKTFVSKKKQTKQNNNEGMGIVTAEDIEDEDEDRDVAAEREVVSGMTDYEDYPVVVHKLTKEYKSLSAHLFPCCGNANVKLAVNGISLAIHKGECFGLLGINGAGKTTTFKMLTGDIGITSGSAFVGKYNVKSQLHLAQQHMGYCPQFDSLIELMTGRELLTLFARLKGIKEKAIPSEVETEIKRMNLSNYADKRCGTYSGGNKRKLSTAIALVGQPPVVFLDEPTSGMDPVTRRFVWNAITAIIKEGRTVILTTHSMEECEALCTRLTIMVNGSLKALGSVQHLKSRFSSGYLLQVKVGSTRSRPTRPTVRDKTKTRRFFSRGRTRPQCDRTLSDEEGKLQDTDLMQGREERVSNGGTRRAFTKAITIAKAAERFKRLVSQRSSQRELKENETPLEAATRKASSTIKRLFPKATMIEKYLGSLTYELPSDGTNVSELFERIEGNKEQIGIIDYSISQPTLEKVFLRFANQQD